KLCPQSLGCNLCPVTIPEHSGIRAREDVATLTRGTLSYMSLEAFVCNQTDADGNIIKCGRPSPIPSLEDQDHKLMKLVPQSFTNSPKASALCNQLERLLMDPLSGTTTDSISVEERNTSTLLYEMSELCVQLKELLVYYFVNY
ncbi:hypothetical protein Tco_0783555, partial [Tanacetum coccineum]